VDNESNTETEVLIVGAGPVGLALALELQRFGIRFRIVEKKAERSKTSKALGLQPRLSEIFGIWGIAHEFFARGFSGVRALNLRVADRKLLTVPVQFEQDLVGRDACRPRLMIIPQSVTEEILETTLSQRGHNIERCRELIGFDQSTDFVNSVIRDQDGVEENIRSRFLVGCEGAHSVVRKEAQFTFAGAKFPMRFLLADVTIDWDLPDNEVQVWFHRDGSFAALPFGAQKWRLIVECADDSNDAASEVTIPLLQNLASKRIGKQILRIRDPVWLSDFRINARMVDRFRDRRVFVAGDAAHIHSPAGGQGIATGIQDATNLGWKLAAFLREGAPESLLDTYDEERKPIARQVLQRTTAVSHIIFALNPVARFFRERLLAPILRTSLVQQRLFAKLSQLEMNYRGRSLSANFGRLFSRVHVRAGDRTPDVVFRKNSGNVSLFDLIRNHGMIALLGQNEDIHKIVHALDALHIRSFIVAPKGSTEPRNEWLVDLHGDFARLYGAHGSFLYLIRPDGHVAMFQHRANASQFAEYLGKIRTGDAVTRSFQF